MRNKVLYILLMITTALSWSLEAGAVESEQRTISISGQQLNNVNNNYFKFTDNEFGTVEFGNGSTSISYSHYTGWGRDNHFLTIGKNTTHVLKFTGGLCDNINYNVYIKKVVVCATSYGTSGERKVTLTSILNNSATSENVRNANVNPQQLDNAYHNVELTADNLGKSFNITIDNNNTYYIDKFEITYTKEEVMHDVLVTNNIDAITTTITAGVQTTARTTASAKTGYKFVNWKLDNGVTYANNTTATSNTIYINATADGKEIRANYNPIKYYIIFNGNGSNGGEMSNQEFTYGVAQNLTPNAFSRSYTVNFNTNGGSTLDSQTATSTFNGWGTSAEGQKEYNNNASVKNLSTTDNASVNLYAKWILGTIEMPSESPIKEGYSFEGWYIESNKYEQSTYTPIADVEFQAHWTPNQYEIAFDAGEGTDNTTPFNASYGEAMPSGKTAPTRTGYTFDGYYDAVNGGTKYYHADMTSAKAWDKANSATLYAHWIPNTYEVVFNGNGSTGGSMANQSFTYGQEQALTANAYTRQYIITFNTDGGEAMAPATAVYNFGGWATSAEGSTAYEDKENVNNLATNGNHTLYAVWSSNYTLPLPTKDGYNFAGWSDGTNTGMQNGTPYAPTTDVTLTAEWTQDMLTPTLQKNYEDAQAAMKVGGDIENAFTLGNVSTDLEIRIVNTPDVTGNEVISCTNTNGWATITALNAGTATLQFHQPQTSTIAEATSSIYTFTVTKNAGTITSQLPATIGITNDLSLNLIASYNKGVISDDVTVTINVSSDKEDVLKFEDGKLKAVALGSANITLSQVENYKYTAANVVVPVQVVKNNDVVTWTEGKNYTLAANTTLDLDGYAVSAHGQTVKYALVGANDDEVATISGDNVLTPIKAGSVTLRAYTEETGIYNAAECASTQTITIEKATPNIIWKVGITSPVAMESLGILDISDYATASTGAAITYTTDNASIASISGNVLTAHKSGTVILTASTDATDIYNTASNTLTINISKIASKIVWNQILPVLTDKTTGSITLTASVVARNDESRKNAGATVIYTSSANGVVRITGNSLTVTGSGNAIITASFAGDDVFDAATSVSKDVTVTGYNATSTWVNDWTNAPTAGSRFYLYNTTNSKLLQEGHGEESRNAFVDTNGATLWTYQSSKIQSVNNNNNFIANRTNQASTNGTGNVSTYNFDYSNGMFRIRNGSGITTYDVFNNNGIFDGYNNGSGHFEWWLISEDQYDYRMIDVPKAIKYLYGEGEYSDYLKVTGKTRQNLVDATKLNSNFAAARSTIAAAMQAFDDYLVELDKIEAFQASIAANTPDVSTAQSNVDNAIAALQGANGSAALKAVYANNITRKFTTLTATYPTLLPKTSTGAIEGIVKSGNEEIDGVVIVYTCNDETILNVSQSGEIQPLKEGHTTITLTTATTEDYYAAIPFTTEEIEVTDRLTLNNNTVANHIPGEYGMVVLERALKAGYSTIALPFDYTLSDLNADWAAQLSIVTYNKKDGYSLYFNKITEGTLNANEPYIIHITEQKVNPQFSDVTVEATSATEKQATSGVSTVSHTYTDWTMHSNYTPNLDMNGKYGVVNSLGKIMMGEGENAKLSAFAAYITGPDNKSAKVKAAYLDDEEVDGILELLQNQGNEETQIYDLQGRQLPEVQRGVNIVRQMDGSVRKIMKR